MNKKLDYYLEQISIAKTGGGQNSNMLYLKGVQTEKLGNQDIISKVVELVEKKAEEIEIK